MVVLMFYKQSHRLQPGRKSVCIYQADASAISQLDLALLKLNPTENISNIILAVLSAGKIFTVAF